MIVRRINRADHQAFERFLKSRADTSMFLRANAAHAGLDWRGEAYQARYFAAEWGNKLHGVLALNWNGNVISQCEPDLLEELFELARAGEPGFEVRGVLAPAAQARLLLEWIEPPADAVDVSRLEHVFALDLSDLRRPVCPGVVRPVTAAEIEALIPWNVMFRQEGHNAAETPQLRAAIRQDLEAWIAEGRVFVLDVDGRPVAQAGFNAVLPDMVQVGMVFTPPEFRGRGYAACGVAGALELAQARGASRATLFTQNPAAERAYARLGFRLVDDYWMALFNRGVSLG